MAHCMLGTFDVGGSSRELQRVTVGANADSKTAFERRQILIELTEEPNMIGQVA